MSGHGGLKVLFLGELLEVNRQMCVPAGYPGYRVFAKMSAPHRERAKVKDSRGRRRGQRPKRCGGRL